MARTDCAEAWGEVSCFTATCTSQSNARMNRPSDDVYYMGIAMAVRERANCTGNRVGAILVRDGRIIASGYNAMPEGMQSCEDGGCMRCSQPDQFPRAPATTSASALTLSATVSYPLHASALQ